METKRKIDNKKLIKERRLGSIERVFCIFLYGNVQNSNAAFKCINRRLNKMPKKLREIKIRDLMRIYMLNCYRGYIVKCRHYFQDGLLKIK